MLNYYHDSLNTFFPLGKWIEPKCLKKDKVKVTELTWNYVLPYGTGLPISDIHVSKTHLPERKKSRKR